MTVPWVNGTIDAVKADLRTSANDDTGIVYASAFGMITGLAHGYTPGRTDAQNLADIRTVCDAVHQLQEELFQARNPGGLR